MIFSPSHTVCAQHPSVLLSVPMALAFLWELELTITRIRLTTAEMVSAANEKKTSSI